MFLLSTRRPKKESKRSGTGPCEDTIGCDETPVGRSVPDGGSVADPQATSVLFHYKTPLSKHVS